MTPQHAREGTTGLRLTYTVVDMAPPLAVARIVARLDAAQIGGVSVRSDNNDVVVEIWGATAADVTNIKHLLRRRGGVGFHRMDESSLIEQGTTLAPGLEVAKEDVPTGAGSRTIRNYVRGGCHPQETVDNCRTRFHEGVAHLRPASGRIVVVGETSMPGTSGEQRGFRTYHLHQHPELDGLAISRVEADDRSMLLHFRDKAQLRSLTAALVDRRLAIVVDGIVHSAPIVRETITDGVVRVDTGAPRQAEQQLRDINRFRTFVGPALPTLVLEFEAWIGSEPDAL